MSFYGEVGLLMLDEVHTVGDDRGSILEAVVSRLRLLSRFPELRNAPISRLRVVAVSATIPNLQDVGQWLECQPQNIKRFGEEHRPVQLKRVVLGFNDTRSSDFMFTKFTLQKQLFSVVNKYSDSKPSLVFLATRKEAVECAKRLAEDSRANANSFVCTQQQAQRLDRAAALAKDRELRASIRFGVAHHNAGLDIADRELVERLFIAGDLAVVTATTTLAVGVNLPAHLVIVCGTARYVAGQASHVEYPMSDIQQMVGRAGRPQFDDSGTCVIMCRGTQEARYRAMIGEGEPLESAFATTMVEQMNVEAALLTVNDVDRAADGMKTTFMFQRMKSNPSHYGLPPAARANAEIVSEKLRALATAAAKELGAAGMLTLKPDGRSFESTEAGVIMARWCVRWPTMQRIVSARPAQGISAEEAVINTVAASAELSNVRLRRNEKNGLNAFNRNKAACRFPARDPDDHARVRKRIASGQEKTKILMNHMIGPPPEFDQTPGSGGGGGARAGSDSSSGRDALPAECINEERGLANVVPRLCKVMAEYFTCTSVLRLDMYLGAMRLAKASRQRLWHDSKLVARQLPDIGPVLSQRLASAGFTSFSSIANADTRLLERACMKDYPFGQQLKGKVAAMLPPDVQLRASTSAAPGGNMRVSVVLSRTAAAGATARQPEPDPGARWAVVCLGSTGTQSIFLRERIDLCRFNSPLELTVQVPSMLGPGEAIRAWLINERLVGCDRAITIAGSNGSPTSSPAGAAGGLQQSQRRMVQSSLNRTMSPSPAAAKPPPALNSLEIGSGAFDLLGNGTPSTTDSEFQVDLDAQTQQQQQQQQQQQRLEQAQERQKKKQKTGMQGRPPCKCRCKDRTTCKHMCWYACAQRAPSAADQRKESHAARTYPSIVSRARTGSS